jgi:hypothetical protein
MFEIQLLGVSESLGFAVSTGCVDYMTAGIVATVCLFLPVITLAYALHRGVSRHATYVPCEGTSYSRFKDHWNRNRKVVQRWYYCFPYGFILVSYQSFCCAILRGRWEPKTEKDDRVLPFVKHPLSAFQRRFGPMFEDFTDRAW